MTDPASSRPNGRADKMNEFWRYFRSVGSSAETERHVSLVMLGILGPLIVVILMLLGTVALARMPVPEPSVAVIDAETPLPGASTSFPSPEQTGTRYTPEPIVVGIPQLTETPTPTPSPSQARPSEIDGTPVCYEDEPCWSSLKCDEGDHCIILPVEPSWSLRPPSIR